MPDLLGSLQKYDLGHLHIVAALWGLELAANEPVAAAEELAACLLDVDLVNELTEALPDDARLALEALVERQGRIPWAEFARRFGAVREMGAGKRDREKPQLHPASAAEALFYRALLARAFFDTGRGLQEFAYIPEDLLPLISLEEAPPPRIDHLKPGAKTQPAPAAETPLGRPASPGEHGEEIPSSDRLLDDATTLLAALRSKIGPPPTEVPLQVVQEFLKAAGLLRESVPQPEPVRQFLEAPRPQAMKMLADGWVESEEFNELRLLPGLQCEGQWSNQPQVTREFLLHLLEALPDGQWWSLPAFIRAVKEKYPDYQRPAGDYDSWFIRRVSDGAYLRGFASWDEVDGALVRYLVTSLLPWLGMAELAKSKEGDAVAAFRLAAPPEGMEEKAKISTSSSGLLSIPRLFPRAVRYQLSRFGEWDGEKAEGYRYRITPVSLRRAQEQGLKVDHLLALLAKYSDAGVPPALAKALRSWELHGTEARVQSQVVLRASRPEILEELRKSRAARFLGESLGPTSVVIKEGAQSRVMAALAEMGLLAEDETPKGLDRD
jgi:hypothetical protein